MPTTATISITQIGNGYIVADLDSGQFGDSEWRFDKSLFYPTLEELATDMPRFVTEAVESADKRDKELQERLAQEDAAFAGVPNNREGQRLRAASQGVRGAIIGRPY